MDKESLLNIINSLCFAILDNNLQLTKEYVEILNTNCNKDFNEDNYNTLNQYNPFELMSYSVINDSYDYMVKNIQNLKLINYYEWFYIIAKIRSTEDNTKMRELIDNFIYHRETVQKYIEAVGFEQVKAHLISFCLMLQDFDSLNQLKIINKD